MKYDSTATVATPMTSAANSGQRERVTVSDAPLVEGAMVAAARAGQDAPLAEVADAAARALVTEKRPGNGDPTPVRLTG